MKNREPYEGASDDDGGEPGTPSSVGFTSIVRVRTPMPDRPIRVVVSGEPTVVPDPVEGDTTVEPDVPDLVELPAAVLEEVAVVEAPEAPEQTEAPDEIEAPAAGETETGTEQAPPVVPGFRPAPVPAPAPSRDGRRRVLVAAGALAAAAVMIVVAAVVVAAPWRDGSDEAAGPPESIALPAAPGDAPTPGRLTDVEVVPDGSARVTEWLAFDEPVRSVSLAAPAGRPGRLSSAVVDGAGGERVDLGASAGQVVELEDASDRVRLRYTVRDAVSLSGQDGDRALIDVPFLGISANEGESVGRGVLRVQDGRVLGAACGTSRRTAQPCGGQLEGAWDLGRAPVRSAVLLASVDLE